MTIPNQEKALQRILDSISQEMEEKYFVCCEIDNGNPSLSTSGLKRNHNGYGDCALIQEFCPNLDVRYLSEEKAKAMAKAHATFENAVHYYEEVDGSYKVYHLRDGIKCIIENNLEIVNELDEVPETFLELWNKWYWDELVTYASQFVDEEEVKQSLLNIVSAFKPVMS